MNAHPHRSYELIPTQINFFPSCQDETFRPDSRFEIVLQTLLQIDVIIVLTIRRTENGSNPRKGLRCVDVRTSDSSQFHHRLFVVNYELALRYSLHHHQKFTSGQLQRICGQIPNLDIR